MGQGLELSPALHFGQIGVGLEHRLEKVPHRKPLAASVDERALGHLVPRHPGPERRRPEGRPVTAFAARTAQGPAHGLEGMLGMHARLILEDKHARTSREARRNWGEARPSDELGRRRGAERGGKEDFVHGSSLHRLWEECRDSTESSATRREKRHVRLKHLGVFTDFIRVLRVRERRRRGARAIVFFLSLVRCGVRPQDRGPRGCV